MNLIDRIKEHAEKYGTTVKDNKTELILIASILGIMLIGGAILYFR